MTNKQNRITEIQKGIIRKLRAENYSYATIGKVMGLNLNTVKSICFRKGIETPNIPRKTKQEKNQLQICKQCGQPINNPWNRPKKQFCSEKCRRSYWNNHNCKQKNKSPSPRAKKLQKDAGLPAPPEVSLDARR